MGSISTSNRSRHPNEDGTNGQARIFTPFDALDTISCHGHAGQRFFVLILLECLAHFAHGLLECRDLNFFRLIESSYALPAIDIALQILDIDFHFGRDWYLGADQISDSCLIDPITQTC